MIKFKDIRKYWDQRASSDETVQSTTNDVYLREIEFTALAERLALRRQTQVADVGCGDGKTTHRLALLFPKAHFVGMDYAPTMIRNAKSLQDQNPSPNVCFEEGDICKGISGTFDIIYTTRCLINLPTWEDQENALRSIYEALRPGGVYIMIENFVEGHNAFNEIRRQFGLAEISIRSHNLFFNREQLMESVAGRFLVEDEINISSTYYLVSRVVYSKMCSEFGEEPNYWDVHHRLGAELPFCGEYGPVRLLTLKKQEN